MDKRKGCLETTTYLQMDLLCSQQYMIIDLDATLVNSWVLSEPSHERLWKKYSGAISRRKDFYIFKLVDEDGEVNYVWGVKRPYVDEFLEFCFSHFKGVAFWSAGGKDYVDGVIDKIVPKKYKPVFIFNRTRCEEKKIPGSKRKDLSKPLIIAYIHFPGMNSKNTWILDDNEDYTRKDKSNWIPIKPFEPEMAYLEREEDKKIDDLMAVINFLKQVKCSPNVQTIPRKWETDETKSKSESKGFSLIPKHQSPKKSRKA